MATVTSAQDKSFRSDYAGVGALVIGGDHQGLGIVRALGRKGIPVCVVDDEFSVSRFSRYTRDFVSVPSLRDPKVIADTLLEVGHRLSLKGWVLYPTRDELVAAIALHREELKAMFRLPTPEWESVRWAWDKRNSYRLADELGIPTPETKYPCSVEDVRKLGARFPVAVKPAIKEHFVYSTKSKAWRADNVEELEKLYHDLPAEMESGEMMVQDMIPGDGTHQFSYCAFFKNGEAVGSMLARRTRQHPPDFGTSTFVETVDIPSVEEYSLRFLRAIDYYGLVEIEYKLDPRDGEYRLLDVNTRTWGFHILGAAAGVDFSYMLFADQVGIPVEPTRGKAGVAWIRLVTDIPTSALEILRGKLSLRTFLRSLSMPKVGSIFDLKDPIPGIAELALVPYLAYRRGF